MDDQPLVRAGLEMILGPEDGFLIVGECADGAEAVSSVLGNALVVDVVLMDVRMKGPEGTAATARIRAVADAPPVLVLTTFDDDAILSAALRAGAAGFLLKDAPADGARRGERWLLPGSRDNGPRAERLPSHWRSAAEPDANRRPDRARTRCSAHDRPGRHPTMKLPINW